MKNQKNTINDPAAHALIAERVCRWEWNKTFMAWRSGNLFITDDPVKPFKTAANREAAIEAARLKGWGVSIICDDNGYWVTVSGGMQHDELNDYLASTKPEAEFAALLHIAQQLENGIH